MERAYVGIDFHRRRSVVVQVDANGERLSVARIGNTPAKLARNDTAAQLERLGHRVNLHPAA